MGFISKLNKNFTTLILCLRVPLLIVSVLVVSCSLSMDYADAQISLRSNGKLLRIGARSNRAAIENAVGAVMSGKAHLRLDLKSTRNLKRTGQVTLQVGGSKIKIPAGVIIRGESILLDPKSSNKKTAGLSLSLLDLLATLVAGLEQNNPIIVPTTFTKVYKEYSLKTCEAPNQTLEDLDAPLLNRYVKVYDSVCATRSSVIQPTVCGQPVTLYRIHTINERDKMQAMIAGFSPINWLKEPVQESPCSQFETVEMTAVIANKACYTPQNTIPALDAKITNQGVRVLAASCGEEIFSPRIDCGETFFSYRKYRIFAINRVKAMSLGLRDSSEFSESVRFGVACPATLMIDPPPQFIKMVGIIFNVSCNPRESTVSGFDKMLSNARVEVFSSSCGFEKELSLLPCPTIYREVLIPLWQRDVAENLGLRSQAFFTDAVSFGQSCPE